MDWVDISALDEMALRLRNAGLWDNILGDGLALMKDRIRLLEKHMRFERKEEAVRRPLKTWVDCRKVLLALSSSSGITFTEAVIDLSSAFLLASLLSEWEKEGAKIPSDVRTMMHGAICVEWNAPADCLIIDKGTIVAGRNAKTKKGKAS